MIALAMDVTTLTLPEVAQNCRRETRKFMQDRPNNPQFCYELFRRGLTDGYAEREAAWHAIYNQYHLQLTRAAQAHPLIREVKDDAEAVADQAFSKMWHSFAKDADKFGRFPTLPTLIKFLQACVHSIIVDSCRRRRDAVEIQPERDAAPTKQISDLEAAQLWETVRQRARDQQELTVIYGCFELALPARKLFDLYPEQFSDVREVYRICERLLRRWRRDEQLQHQLAAYL